VQAACHNGPALGGNSFQKMGLVEPYETSNPAEGVAGLTGKDTGETIIDGYIDGTMYFAIDFTDPVSVRLSVDDALASKLPPGKAAQLA
jgi:cytochrome c peroxidase